MNCFSIGLASLCYALREVTVTEDGFDLGVFERPPRFTWDAIRSYAWKDDTLELLLSGTTHRWRIAPDVRPALDACLREHVGPPSPHV